MVYAVLDPRHTPWCLPMPGICGRSSSMTTGEHFLDVERGLPLGLGCGDYSETLIYLSSGSKLIFYSDGITEAENAELTKNMARPGLPSTRSSRERRR